ncbi:hypothetical protein [Porphyromonas uenonis]|uniref:hypothetical protein n=1 Tax=Porphyromonas uenonis TaxID=281920 RepID=UPI0004709221|nr:hypothetical protein [Porphyromonas uenonis]
MNKQIYLVLALILSTCFGLVGCYPECPDDGGDPNKEDTIPMGKYTPIYELDADGNLKHLPIPFVDFTAGELPLKKWEAAHGAMLAKEVVADFKGQKIKNYVFNTQDKSGKQPLRIYLVGNAGQGKLQISTLLIDKKLVYNEQGEIRKEFDMMTINDGFTAMDDISSKTPMYSKGNLVVGVSQSKDQAGYAQLSFLPLPGSVAKVDLDKTLKDFPFTSKKAEETSLDEIRKYETALGLRQEKPLNDPKRANFVAKDKNKGNFDLVSYYPKGYTSNGETYKPGILALSYALTIKMVESNPDVAEWFVNNGFSKPQKTAVGNNAYSSENEYYTLLIMEAQGGVAFSFSAKKEAPTPDPAEDTSIFPSYNFGEKFNPADEPTPGTPAGSIYTSEMAKGEDVTYYAPVKGDDGKIDYASTRLQVSIKDLSKFKAAAINGYHYCAAENATKDNMHVYNKGALTINSTKQFKTGIDKELKAALEKAGYQYTGLGKDQLGNEYWYYYNAEHGISLHVVKLTGIGSKLIVSDFWPGDDYKPQAGKQIRLNTHYMHR